MLLFFCCDLLQWNSVWIVSQLFPVLFLVLDLEGTELDLDSWDLGVLGKLKMLVPWVNVSASFLFCLLNRFVPVVRQTIRWWVDVVLADSANEENHHDKSLSDVWLRPNLRVRIVDDRYRHGKYYKTKVQHSL